MKEVLLESIVHFQDIESFEESTGLVYKELDAKGLFEALVQWHYPGEHETYWYSYSDIDTPFLGFRCEDKYLLARHEHGRILGLSYMLEVRNGSDT